MEEFNAEAIIRAAIDDDRIEGFYKRADGQWMLDRRLRLGENPACAFTHPICADLNLIGPDQLPVTNISNRFAKRLGIYGVKDQK